MALNEYVLGTVVTVTARFDVLGLYRSTLAAAASSIQLTVVVASATGIPVAPFRLLIDDEIMTVTLIAGTTLTVSRGAEETLAVAHGSGADVAQLDAADPTAITLTQKAPDGTEVAYGPTPGAAPVVAPIVRTSLGRFSAALTPASEGDWQFRWVGTGAAAGAIEGEFRVISLLGGPGVLLEPPEDYDGIRKLLGVTETDLQDETIERVVFLAQAEFRVKDAVTTWATIDDTPDGLKRLRITTMYVTAALIAESAARGGFIGLAGKMRTPDDWAKEAAFLWMRANELIGILAALGTDPLSSEFGVPMMVIGSQPDRTAELPTPPQWAEGYGVIWRE